MSQIEPLAPAEEAALRAVWQRIRPYYCTATFEQAIAWPAMRIVLAMAARAFDPQRQNVEHPALRAMAHTYALRPPAPPRSARGKRKPHRPDVKQRQAHDVDLFDPLEVP